MCRRNFLAMSIAAGAVFALVLYGVASAQWSGPAGAGGTARGGDLTQMRKALAEQMKKDLGVSDEEFTAMQPRIEKVQNLRNEMLASTMTLMYGNMMRMPTTQPDAKVSDLQEKTQALRKVVDNKDSKSQEIRDALAAYRDARAKARAEQEKAQKELKEILTPRQEAILVMKGLLE